MTLKVSSEYLDDTTDEILQLDCENLKYSVL